MSETVTTPAPNVEFAVPADRKRLERVAAALESHGIHALVASNAEEAKRLVLEQLPEGAQVHEGASLTMDTLGVTEEIEESGRYDAVRPRTRAMDPETQMDDIRRLGSAPDYMTGSVHAVTEDGQLLIASATGSQLGPHVYGAGHVVLAAGSQKIVRDVEEGQRRIREYTFPLEDRRAWKAYGQGSAINKLLIINGEVPGRITVILLDEPLGF